MNGAQLAALLDAAMQSPYPLSFLDAVVTSFKTIGRHKDATAAAWVGCLYAEGEIEPLMSLRAAWIRGEETSPREAARVVARAYSRSGNPFPQRAAGSE